MSDTDRRAFVALVEAGSSSAAARRLGVCPKALRLRLSRAGVRLRRAIDATPEDAPSWLVRLIGGDKRRRSWYRVWAHGVRDGLPEEEVSLLTGKADRATRSLLGRLREAEGQASCSSQP